MTASQIIRVRSEICDTAGMSGTQDLEPAIGLGHLAVDREDP